MYLFAFFLVLYEFTTYSANDMIMPGMIQVVNHFHASQYYVALSMSFYILGNCFFLLLTGFLSERYGKRRIILTGNFLFLFFTLAELLSHNINEFMLWRFLQGAGMSIIAIGYATIHENFDDKKAIKIAALMANVSLLAPLIGPALGSIIMTHYDWKYIFIACASVSLITLVGLYQTTPIDKITQPITHVKQILIQYIHIIKNKEFLLGTFSLVFSLMALLIWISQAPNLILYHLHQDYLHYTIYQLISIGGLSISSIAMQYIVGRYSLYSIVKIGNVLTLLGLGVGLIGFNSINIIVAGLFIYTFGIGLVNGCVMRLIMTIKGYSQGLLATLLSFIETFLFVIAIMLSNQLFNYFNFSFLSFTSVNFLLGVIGYILTITFISPHQKHGWH
jgi:DHA1 family multidrug/chloramphenicol efflux transport protein-like MFS transporter